MFKKIAYLSVSFAFAVSTVGFAAQSKAFSDLCSVTSNTPVYLLSSDVVSGDVRVVPANPGGPNFYITEQQPYPLGDGGIVKVVIGTDSAHSCTFTLQDQDFDPIALGGQSCVGGYNASFSSTGENNAVIKITTGQKFS